MVLLAVVPAIASDKRTADSDDLVQLARAAKDSFRPIDPQRLQDCRASLVAAMDNLDRFMLQSGREVANGWKAFLDWPTLQTEVYRDRPDWQTLSGVLARFYQNHPGIEMPRCLAVRQQLRRFISIGMLLTEPEPQAAYEARLDELTRRLEEFRTNPSGEHAAAIGKILGTLQLFEPEGRQLAEAVRARCSLTNGLGVASDRLVNRIVARNAFDERTVREYILGTSTVGSAQTEGRVFTKLIPNPQQAAFDVHLVGTAKVEPNVGYRGSLTIYSTADTQIDARKRVYIDATGVHPEPTRSDCTTDVQVYDIEAPRTITEIFARRMANRKNPEAEREGALRAELRSAQQLDTDANGMLAVANNVMLQQFRAPLVRLGAYPSSISFSSTEQHLQASALLANDSQLGAWDAQPQLDPLHDMAVCMHESLVNNVGETLIGGRTFKDTAWLEMVQMLTADAPKPLWVTSQSERWSTVLAKHQPLTVVFANDRCWITIRLQQFQRGDVQLQRPLQIQAEYQLQVGPDRPHLIRQGDLQIALTDGGESTPHEAGIVSFVRQKFAGVLQPDVGFEMSLPTEKLSTLELKEFSTRGGWLILGYQLFDSRSRLLKVASQED